MRAVAVVGAGAVRCRVLIAVLPAGQAWEIRKDPWRPGGAGGLPVAGVSTQAGLPGSVAQSLGLTSTARGQTLMLRLDVPHIS